MRLGGPETYLKARVHSNYLKDLTVELPAIRTLEDITKWLSDLELEGETYSDAYISVADS